MFPILAQLGPVTLYTFPVLVNLGLALGLTWVYLQAPQEKRKRWVDATLTALIGGLIGARLVYVMVNSGYYGQYLGEVWQVWRGGLAWPGAVLGGFVGAWAYCYYHNEPLRPVIDACALPMAWITVLAWGGCLGSGCAYGYEVPPGALPGWLTIDIPDVYGAIIPRWPTALAGLGWSAFNMGLVWGARQRWGRAWGIGALGFYALGLVALGAFGLSFTRGDPIALVSGYRLDTIGSALVLVIATLTWGALATRPKPVVAETPPTNV